MPKFRTCDESLSEKTNTRKCNIICFSFLITCKGSFVVHTAFPSVSSKSLISVLKLILRWELNLYNRTKNVRSRICTRDFFAESANWEIPDECAIYESAQHNKSPVMEPLYKFIFYLFCLVHNNEVSIAKYWEMCLHLR